MYEVEENFQGKFVSKVDNKGIVFKQSGEIEINFLQFLYFLYFFL